MTAVVAPIVLGAAVVGLWELFVKANDIKPYLLPAPSAIWAQFRRSFDLILDAAWVTGLNALVGLLVGLVLGLLAALVAARSRIADGMLGPIAAAMNAIPIIALAPLLNTMFSATSSVPRRMVVAIVVFFPVFVNTARGLRQVSPVQRELMRSLNAGPGAFARMVQLPGALPYFFTGFRLASSLAIIAAVVAEYFGGRQNGLGSRIASAAASSGYPRAWAFVIAACLIGILVYLVAGLLEWLATPWRRAGSAAGRRRRPPAVPALAAAPATAPAMAMAPATGVAPATDDASAPWTASRDG
ncbi:ABC transporter permease [Frankia nepalensis]|uniref:ABC transporter permease n=1 Tax=Frankia nepalensis TaxID=1836974 RepID=UPI001DABA5A8|nr:ABC transporter permease subunit [Frankia nepalensis]MBL7497245.1 ABC transporter permease subunit [Frankia nepalensis]MBL7512947.1 ABC transporter permease subunit [Frankia nepalensis]